MSLSLSLSLCSIDFSLITFNWFHTVFVDNLPVDVSNLVAIISALYMQLNFSLIISKLYLVIHKHAIGLGWDLR